MERAGAGDFVATCGKVFCATRLEIVDGSPQNKSKPRAGDVLITQCKSVARPRILLPYHSSIQTRCTLDAMLGQCGDHRQTGYVILPRLHRPLEVSHIQCSKI